MAYTDIDKPSDYFRVKIYNGDSGTGSAQTWDETDTNFGTNLFLWLKNRTSAQEHWLADSVRGTGKFLESNSSNAESSDGASGLASFDTNGFTLNNSARTNRNTMVGWGWKKTATAGFDIVAYTGTGSSNAVSHSLSATPSMIIIKNRDDSDNWYVWHQGLGAVASNYINLDTTGAKSSVSDGITAISSSNFTVNTRGDVNENNMKYIAYCFAEKKGYSKFSSFVGNGSNDGSFCFTGMKPSFIMIKRTSGTGGWFMFDNKRDTFNLTSRSLQADISGAENNYTATDTMNLDILSNGFKLRSTDGAVNRSGDTYIYMAFAENPFTTSTGVPATAR